MGVALNKLAAMRGAIDALNNLPTALDNLRQEAFHTRGVADGTRLWQNPDGTTRTLTVAERLQYSTERMLAFVKNEEARMGWLKDLPAGQRAAVVAALGTLTNGAITEVDLSAAESEVGIHVATLKSAMTAARNPNAVVTALDSVLATVQRPLKVSFRDSVP